MHAIWGRGESTRVGFNGITLGENWEEKVLGEIPFLGTYDYILRLYILTKNLIYLLKLLLICLFILSYIFKDLSKV